MDAGATEAVADGIDGPAECLSFFGGLLFHCLEKVELRGLGGIAQTAYAKADQADGGVQAFFP